MHQLPFEQQILDALQVAALLALCVKLRWSGLYKLYVFFFGYLVLQFGQSLIPLFIPLHGVLYRNSYVASQSLIICAYALVILELYSVILHNLPGIAGIARRFIKITLAVALVVSLLPLSVEKAPSTLTGYLFIFERPVLSSLVVLLLLISAFLVYYPVPLGRNVIVYLVGYLIYFLANTTVALINNLGYFWNRSLSDLEMGVSVACLVFWLVALNRQGEDKSWVVGHQWNPGDEERLMAQLEAVNATLLRSTQKQNQE